MNTLETLRTILRRPNYTTDNASNLNADLARMQKLDRELLVMQYTPMRVPQSEEQSKARLTAQLERQKSLEPYGVWLGDVKADQSFLGWFMLMPVETKPEEAKRLELGFMIVREHWGQGLTTEVAVRLIDYAKELATHDVLVARTDTRNTASIRTLEKLGFKFVETKMQPERYFEGETPIHFFERPL